MKLGKLLQVEKIVEEILRKEELTRVDDCFLILRVIQKMYPEFTGRSFAYVMMNGKKHGISFESITRARRKVQKKHPELVDKKTEETREAEQLEYMEFNNENHIPGL